MIAWFAETFTAEAEPAHDPDRDLLDRLMTARRLLVRLAAQIRQLGEHRQPRVVDNAQRAMIETIRTQLAKLEAAAVQARIAANAKLVAGAAIIHGVPGFGTQFVASPACASPSSSSTPCWHAVRCGTRRSPPQPQPRSHERV